MSMSLLFSGVQVLLWFNLLTVAVCIWAAWQWRKQPAGRAFQALMLCVALWILGDLAMLGADGDFEHYRFWRDLRRPVGYLSPIFMLAFVLAITSMEHLLTRRSVVLLGLLPAFVTVIGFTPFGELLAKDGGEIHRFGSVVLQEFQPGPLQHIQTAYAYTLCLVSLGILIQKLWHPMLTQRWQIFCVLMALLLPFLTNLTWRFGALPTVYDPTPVSFFLLAVLLLLALVRFRLLELLPAAYRTIYEQLATPVILLDREGRLAGLNQATRQLLGERTLQLGMDRAGLNQLLPGLCHEKNLPSSSSEGRLVMKSGDQSIQFQTRRCAVVSKSGKPLGTAIVLHDVTDLIRARETAEKAVRFKNDFIAGMSHEIRTPLNAVIGFAELLRENAQPDQQTALKTIKSSGESLLRLINDILDHARLGSGQLRFQLAVMSPEELLVDLDATFGQRLREKGRNLRRELKQALPPRILGDRVRMGQILGNLLENARKYGKGTVLLSAEFKRNSDNHGTLIFEVQDEGQGIPEAQRASVFNAFRRLDNVGSEEGVGLGLAISREIARSMDGDLELLQGELGAHFRFSLPVQTPLQTSVASTTSRDTVRLSGGSALIVDDKLDNREVAGGFLDRLGLAHQSVATIDEAQQALNQQRPDVILLDLWMPGGGGLSFLNALRKGDADKADIPVVVVTASIEEVDERNALACGANAFLRKPLSIEELGEALAVLLPEESHSPPCDPLPAPATIAPLPRSSGKERNLDAHVQEWREVCDELILNRVRAFAENIGNEGRHHGDDELVEWADTLRQHVDDLDFKAMAKQLSSFAHFLPPGCNP